MKRVLGTWGKGAVEFAGSGASGRVLRAADLRQEILRRKT
jgi:hypothetical protein